MAWTQWTKGWTDVKVEIVMKVPTLVDIVSSCPGAIC